MHSPLPLFLWGSTLPRESQRDGVRPRRSLPISIHGLQMRAVRRSTPCTQGEQTQGCSCLLCSGGFLRPLACRASFVVLFACTPLRSQFDRRLRYEQQDLNQRQDECCCCCTAAAAFLRRRGQHHAAGGRPDQRAGRRREGDRHAAHRDARRRAGGRAELLRAHLQRCVLSVASHSAVVSASYVWPR